MTDTVADSNAFFNFQRRSGCLIFYFTAQVNPSNHDAFKRAFEDTVSSENPAALLLVPQNPGVLTGSLLRALAATAIYYRDHNLHTYFVTDTPSEVEFIKNSGMGKTFTIVPTVENVLSPQAPRIDVNFINPFVDATLNALQGLAEIRAKPGKSYIKSDKTPAPNHADIAAVIGLTSKHFRGSVAICFSGATLYQVTSRIAKKPIASIDGDAETALSQLMGHLFYNAAIRLGDRGYSFEQAVPTIVKGRALEVLHLAPTPTLILPFNTEIGLFWMEITVTL